MLTAPKLPAKQVQELVRLALAIPRCPGAPAKQEALRGEFNRLGGLELAVWQFDGAIFWPSETRTFVECALCHRESPDAPTDADAVQWIDELRARKARMADVHQTLRSLERRAQRPEEVARLVFFTGAPAADVLAAIAHDDAEPARRLLALTEEAGLELGDVDADELAAIVALADEGVDCADRGDRAGVTAAARAVSRRTGQRVTEQELRALPGAMDTDAWVRGLLLARDLLERTALTWSGFHRALARYFAAIDGLREPETNAFATLLAAATPYPHSRVHPEMRADRTDLRAIADDITRHVAPWGDPPPVPTVTVESVRDTARAWARARAAQDWHRAVALRTELQTALATVDVPELRELLTLPEAERRARMRALGLCAAESDAPRGPESPESAEPTAT
jgi:protein-disulfide isomerase-like protein with CxxC motif